MAIGFKTFDAMGNLTLDSTVPGFLSLRLVGAFRITNASGTFTMPDGYRPRYDRFTADTPEEVAALARYRPNGRILFTGTNTQRNSSGATATWTLTANVSDDGELVFDREASYSTSGIYALNSMTLWFLRFA